MEDGAESRGLKGKFRGFASQSSPFFRVILSDTIFLELGHAQVAPVSLYEYLGESGDPENLRGPHPISHGVWMLLSGSLLNELEERWLFHLRPVSCSPIAVKTEMIVRILSQGH